MRDNSGDDFATTLLAAENLSLTGLWTGLSFAVDSGRMLLITGDNGAGKTSLIRILCGLSTADSGRVFWRQCDIAENSEDYQAEILYVGHRDGLKDDLTAAENIAFAAALQKSPPHLSPQKALAQLGVPCHVHCRDLSAGQRRRVALARLLANQATLWLLDEPFTALDEDGKQLLADAVAMHLKNGGALVMSSHQLPNWNIATDTLHLTMQHAPIAKSKTPIESTNPPAAAISDRLVTAAI